MDLEEMREKLSRAEGRVDQILSPYLPDFASTFKKGLGVFFLNFIPKFPGLFEDSRVSVDSEDVDFLGSIVKRSLELIWDQNDKLYTGESYRVDVPNDLGLEISVEVVLPDPIRFFPQDNRAIMLPYGDSVYPDYRSVRLYKIDTDSFPNDTEERNFSVVDPKIKILSPGVSLFSFLRDLSITIKKEKTIMTYNLVVEDLEEDKNKNYLKLFKIRVGKQVLDLYYEPRNFSIVVNDFDFTNDDFILHHSRDKDYFIFGVRHEDFFVLSKIDLRGGDFYFREIRISKDYSEHLINFSENSITKVFDSSAINFSEYSISFGKWFDPGKHGVGYFLIYSDISIEGLVSEGNFYVFRPHGSFSFETPGSSSKGFVYRILLEYFRKNVVETVPKNRVSSSDSFLKGVLKSITNNKGDQYVLIEIEKNEMIRFIEEILKYFSRMSH